jgi:ligand-binding sensor domain-containing protein/serine phosphatase RsbU (regulator of sigma subunit)
LVCWAYLWALILGYSFERLCRYFFGYQFPMYGLDFHIFLRQRDWLPIGLSLVGLFLGQGLCLAQEYNFKHLTVKDGLAQNQCRAVLTDPFNNVWIATNEGGLSKYDGQNMTNFSVKDGLPSSIVYDLESDRLGNIWIATHQGLCVYDGFGFQTLEPRLNVRQLQVSAQGKIWFLSENRLGFVDESRQIQRLDIELPKDVLDFVVVGKDSLLVCSRMGEVFLFDGKQMGPLLWGNQPLKGILGAFKTGVQQATLFGSDRVWGFDKRLFLDSALFPLAGEKPYCALRDNKGNFWVGNKNGVSALWGSQKVVLGESSGIAGTILSMCQDRENGIWFASSLGLYRYRDAGFVYYTQKHGVADKYITSLAVERNGTIWFTTAKGLQFIEPGKQARFADFLPKELFNSPRPVVLDDNRNLLVGTPYGIFRKKNKGFDRFNFSGGDWDYLICALPLGGEKMLFGGSVGLWLFDGKKISKFLPQITSTVNALASASGGIWIATEGEGLYFAATDSLYHLNGDNGKINNNIVNCLAVDKIGNLWAGSSGTGLFKINKSHPSGKFINFEHLNLGSNNVYSIVIDDSTNIWVGTDKGISRITILQNDNINVKNIGEQDGFRAIEVYHGSAAKHGGQLWFGTVDGLTAVAAKARLTTEKPPITYLKDIKVFQQSRNWSAYSKKIDRWTGIPESSSLQLPSDENYLSFQFVSTSHNQAGSIQYFWMLQGYDLKWNGPTFNGEAFYPNLPAGDYIFRVRACAPSGVCEDNAVQYKFSIKRPFYLRTWFWVLLLAMSTLALFYYISHRLRLYSQERADAKARERQRSLNLKSQEEQLNRKSRQLKRTMLELDKTNSTLSQINEELTASLTYARRILNIILYSKENLSEVFPKSFYYDCPRKIVNGDYMWVHCSEPYVYLALVDCTASGVSAAFLAIMADSVVKKVITEAHNNTPSELLTKFNEKICEILQTDTQHSEDGIDMAVCRFERGSQKMLFAGAKSAVHYSQESDIVSLKGNFYSLGLEFAGVECRFDDIEVELDPKAWIYFYTSGYPNQLGGPEAKRFKSLRMKDLLQKITPLSQSEQVAILDMEFQNWKGDNLQLEDVLVVGIQPFESELLKAEQSGALSSQNSSAVGGA